MQSLNDIEKAILRAVQINGSLELRRGTEAAQNVTTFMPNREVVGSLDFMEAMSSLVSRRLVFIEFSQPDSAYWSLRMSERGNRLVDGSDISPDDPRGYMSRLLAAYPDTSTEIKFYLTEALRAYEGEAYAASTVMIGVAAEQCFYEVASVFVEWLEGDAKKKFNDILSNKKSFYVYKMEEFQKRLLVAKSDLSPELSDSLETQVLAAMHLIRSNRNDAGHPTKILVDSFTAYTNIAIYWRLHQKMYALRDFFIKNKKIGNAIE